jgi:predicted O-methyltransferase YrrM
MVFMDGPKGHYLKHFQLAVPLMAEEALVISDNILLGGMMTGEASVSRRNMTMVRRMDAYLRYITSLSGFETSVLALGDGIAVTIKSKDAGDPRIPKKTEGHK